MRVIFESNCQTGNKTKPEMKKRGRKRKSETAAAAAEASKPSFEEPEFIIPDSQVVVEKKTRSGRISKPKKNDDMVRIKFYLRPSASSASP